MEPVAIKIDAPSALTDPAPARIDRPSLRSVARRTRPRSVMQVLVVDDDQAVRDSLQRSLQYSGYEVTLVEDGLQALALLATHRPDAVIMDVMMPRLDGLEATRMLRAAGNDVPILVLTARDAINDRGRRPGRRRRRLPGQAVRPGRVAGPTPRPDPARRDHGRLPPPINPGAHLSPT
ncbi:hypothetical protein GCM10022204_41820 [Microlunatus aurantiacus]|uniref:Response regulatory domain-containing protein n=1 Tax=Microlunatus aurantiacus TaxID=446786 RepID=A0ABP7EI72_9ACTN